MEDLKITISPYIELRLLKLEDAENLFELTQANRNYLREWLSWLDENKTLEDTKKFIEGGLKRFENKSGMELGIWYKDQLVGVIGLPQLKLDHKKCAFGYWLSEDFQKHGIMTKAVKGLISYLFEELKLNRVEINCAVGNKKSCAIPERLGFHCEGVTRQAEWLYDHFIDWNTYSILASEWK